MKKFNMVYTLGRVAGDTYPIVGKDGQSYTLVPITLINGWKCNAFCSCSPEIDSLVLVRAVARDTGLSYTVYQPNDTVKQFIQSACTDVQ